MSASEFSLSSFEFLSQALIDWFTVYTEEKMGVADEQFISEAYRRVERIGYSVGAALFERRSGDRLFQDPLDAMKFICKEFWPLFYQKQIDNLKTNHRVGRCWILYNYYLLIGHVCTAGLGI
jgi:hypothetical protein